MEIKLLSILYDLLDNLVTSLFFELSIIKFAAVVTLLYLVFFSLVYVLI